MPKFFLIISFLLSCQLLSAQDFTTRKTTTPKALKFYKSGRQAASVKDIPRAIKFFAKALKEDPKFIDAKINVGHLRYDSKDYENAKEIYKEALAIAPDYSANLYYNLAMVEWKTNEFEAAVEFFEFFLKKETKQNRRVERAKIYIRNGRFIAKALQTPVPYTPKRLSDNINSAAAYEYLPSISADDETFIFTRRGNTGEDFYYSKKTDSGWSEAKPLIAMNTPTNEGAQTISADGKWFIYTICNRKDVIGRCDLFYTRQIKANQWTKPKNIGRPINTPYRESEPSLSADGKTLCFTSDRSGSIGKSDIWMSHRNADGKWSEPKNLGDIINTPFEEQSPFLHADGKTLYFRSDGHPGMGDDDLFVSRLLSDNTWSTPQNLGYPINTQGEEGSLFVARDGESAYFASNRNSIKNFQTKKQEVEESEKPRIDIDIFSFDLPEAARATPVTYVKAIVKDATTKRPLQATAELTNLTTQKINYDDTTDKSGSFLVCLPMGENYALHVSKEGYLFHSENFQLQEGGSLAEPFVLEIFLEKIQEATATTKIESKPVILKNVFFATASAELQPESVNELMRLKKLLDDSPGIKIQLNGHTDDVGEEADNRQLSKARAKAVQDFLIEKGIDSARLTYKGFGESQPIDSNETEIGRQNNRRTEFLIL